MRERTEWREEERMEGRKMVEQGRASPDGVILQLYSGASGSRHSLTAGLRGIWLFSVFSCYVGIAGWVTLCRRGSFFTLTGRWAMDKPGSQSLPLAHLSR